MSVSLSLTAQRFDDPEAGRHHGCIPAGSSPRRVLHRLLLVANDAAVRARRDEFALDRGAHSAGTAGKISEPTAVVRAAYGSRTLGLGRVCGGPRHVFAGLILRHALHCAHHIAHITLRFHDVPDERGGKPGAAHAQTAKPHRPACLARYSVYHFVYIVFKFGQSSHGAACKAVFINFPVTNELVCIVL